MIVDMQNHISKQFHQVEDHIIQMNGLIKALDIIVCDSAAEICVLNAIKERAGDLEKDFSSLWKQLFASS